MCKVNPRCLTLFRPPSVFSSPCLVSLMLCYFLTLSPTLIHSTSASGDFRMALMDAAPSLVQQILCGLARDGESFDLASITLPSEDMAATTEGEPPP